MSLTLLNDLFKCSILLSEIFMLTLPYKRSTVLSSRFDYISKDNLILICLFARDLRKKEFAGICIFCGFI